MAGNKTGRRKRRRSQLRVFMVSLMIVLFAGSAAMLAYSEARTPKTTKSPLVMNFDKLGQTEELADTDNTASDEDAASELQEQTTEAETDTVLADNSYCCNFIFIIVLIHHKTHHCIYNIQ